MVAAGYPVQTEVQISADDAKRMDLVVYLSTTQLWVDVSVLITREPENWVAAYKLQLMHRIAAVLAYSNHLVLEEARLRTASIRFNSYCLYRGLKRYQGPVIEVY